MPEYTVVELPSADEILVEAKLCDGSRKWVARVFDVHNANPLVVWYQILGLKGAQHILNKLIPEAIERMRTA